jgi:hypothetical protein
MDLYFTSDGDLAMSPSGDLAITETPWRDDVQQAYIRVMTDEGDYLLYPNLGASLSTLYGMPQSPETGSYGESLIVSALNREGRFSGKPFSVNAVPTGPQSIRFDVDITSGSREAIRLSVEQNLGLQGEG